MYFFTGLILKPSSSKYANHFTKLHKRYEWTYLAYVLQVLLILVSPTIFVKLLHGIHGIFLLLVLHSPFVIIQSSLGCNTVFIGCYAVIFGCYTVLLVVIQSSSLVVVKCFFGKGTSDMSIVDGTITKTNRYVWKPKLYIY